MKHLTKLVICTFILWSETGFSQVGKICNWKDDKKASVVLTFDDWSPGHYPVVVPELNSRGLKGTFYLSLTSVASWNHDWPSVNNTANAGHEIANHAVNHPNLLSLTAAELNTQIRGAKNTIDQNVTGQEVLTFAYPFGAGAGATAKDIQVRDTIKASGHIAARGVEGPSGVHYTYNFASTADDYYKIHAYGMTSSTTLNAYAAEVHATIEGGGMLVYLYHSVDDAAGSHGDSWYETVLQTSLQQQLDTLVKLQDDIWITTFLKSVKYHKERKSATLSQVQAPDGSVWIVELKDTLSNNTIYNEPLTIKLKRNGVAYTNVVQNGNTLVYTTIGDTIQFDAVPDGGEIVLSTTVLPENESPTLDALANSSIDQTDGVQTVDLSGITAGGSESQTLTVTATALNPGLIQNLTVNYNSPDATGSISFSPNPSASGVTTIVVRVTDDGLPARFVERSFTVSVAAVATSTRESIISGKGLTLSPNPASGNVVVQMDKPVSSAIVSLEDLSGTTVYERSFTSTDQMQLDLTGRKPGVYILKVNAGKEVLVKKLVVQ